MLDNVKKIWKKSLTKVQMIDYIMSMDEHYWIRNDQYINLNMVEFLERLPLSVLHKVFYMESTIFVQSTGRFACSVTNLHQNAILVFPELFDHMTN